MLDKFDEMVRKLRAAPSWEAARSALGIADDTPEGWAAHAVWVMLGKQPLRPDERADVQPVPPALFVPLRGDRGRALPTDVRAAYYVGVGEYRWRGGKPLRILGVVFCESDLAPPGPRRKCYLVQDPVDAVCDYMPIDDEQYHIISQDDVDAGRIPRMDP